MGHPGRRAMLRSARDEERTASELAAIAGLSPSAASPHLKLLRETGLMHVRVDAKRRLYRVDLAAARGGASRLGRALGRSPRRPQVEGRSSQPARSPSTNAVGMKLVEKRIFIAASPTRVYELLTDEELLVEWMAPHAELDPRPGGTLTWTHSQRRQRRRDLRRTRPLSPHRVHLRVGPRRRPHPTGIDHRGDQPAPARGRHRAPPRPSGTCRTNGRRTLRRMEQLPGPARRARGGSRPWARPIGSRTRSRRPRSRDAMSARAASSSGERKVLEARRPAPHAGRCDPLDHDGLPVPAPRRRLLCQL